MRPIRTLVSNIIAFSLILSLAFAPAAYAEPSNSQKAQDAQSQASAATQEAKQLAEQAEAASKKVLELEPQVNEAVAKTNKLKAEEKDLTKRVKKATKDLEESREQLAVRVENMYRQPPNFFLDLILSSGTISELVERATYVEVVADANNKAAQEYDVARKELSTARKELRVVLKDAEAAEAKVTAVQDKYKAAESTANAKLDEKNKLVAKLQKDASSYNAMAAEQASASQASWSSVSGGASSGSGKYSGKLTWPVPSSRRISSGWGDSAGRSKPHNAIDIAAPSGSTVVAAANGKVIKVTLGWGGGYGNNIWIDHGNGLVTCYNHLRDGSVKVSAGQQVSRGQAIAGVGSTGYSTGPHLDFQVMANGGYRNPMDYL